VHPNPFFQQNYAFTLTEIQKAIETSVPAMDFTSPP
jgi:hypothetical protein